MSWMYKYKHLRQLYGNAMQYEKICDVCRKSFVANYKTIKKCEPCLHLKRCKTCDTVFLTLKQRCNVCVINKSREKFTEENKYDWIECQICGFRGNDISTHIFVHGLKSDEYKSQYDVTTTKSQLLCDRVKGDKNPAYGHGGKYSAHSDNFIKYDGLSQEEKNSRKQEVKEKQMATALSNPESCNTKPEYWMKQEGLTYEEAVKRLSIRQSTFSKEICIDEHGPLFGEVIWQERQDKWQDTLKAKPVEELARINFMKHWKHGLRQSKTEHAIFEELKKLFPELETQFQIRSEFNNTASFYYDFRLGNKLIEYNGDYWHANPKIYTVPDQELGYGMVASEKWGKDARKSDNAKNAGYQLHVIWESDYKENKEETLRKCIQFLKD